MNNSKGFRMYRRKPIIIKTCKDCLIFPQLFELWDKPFECPDSKCIVKHDQIPPKECPLELYENGSQKAGIKLFFAWYDLWIGAYWSEKNQTLYICPFPCVVIAIHRGKPT